MLLVLLSVNGTLRTLLWLVLIYLVVRTIMRSRSGGGPKKNGAHWTQEPQRPPGDVRIERPNDQRGGRGQGNVEDADYEEIK